jgi:hypothetical protein
MNPGKNKLGDSSAESRSCFARDKILVVALFTACMVNVACLCGHLSARSGFSATPGEWIAGPGLATIVRKALL